jgi:hypothetical protein
MVDVNEEKPDWNQLVRERLGKRPLHLPPHAQEEVIAELAAHLEEVSQNARANGLTDSAATALALQEVQDWRVLSAQISRARSKEERMNHRTKTLWLPAIAILFTAGLILVFLGRAVVVQRLIWIACTAMLLCAAATERNLLNQRTKSLWLPALTTFFGASLSLMLCQFFGLQPRIVWVGRIPMWFYWPWLTSLPVFGAMGASLSRRAQGLAPARLAAGLSPALIMLTVMLLILPWGLAIDGMDFFRLVSFGLGLINWVAIPAIALLLGAAPFLHEPKPAEVY